MNRYHEQIAAVIKSTIFHSPTTYSWFSKSSPQLPPDVSHNFTHQDARNYLLFMLRSQLYKEFYCKGFAILNREENKDIRVNHATTFINELSSANFGKGYLEDGWELLDSERDKMVIRKGDLKLWVNPEDCLFPKLNGLPSNKRLSLKFPKEFLGLTTGFYLAKSNIPLPEDESQNLVRIYWNIKPEGAIILMRKLTLILNQAKLPFKLKVLNDPAHYNRCDAAVLYIQKSHYKDVSNILCEIYPKISIYLKKGVPALTKLLAPGLGLAEEPSKGKSFGVHRCKLLAEGMLLAYEQRKESIDERLQVVEEHFAVEGISLKKPFLNADSRDIYDFNIPGKPLKFFNDVSTECHKDFSEGMFLKTANEIGWRLSQDAVWYKECCNWVGAEDETSLMKNSDMRYRSLSPELYSGTSGIALFMAELYMATGDSKTRSTAIGAIRQALSYCDNISCDNRLGLYTGLVGVAFAAVRIGKMFEQEELILDAVKLLKHLMKEQQKRNKFDIISGRAGAIAAIRIIQELHYDKSLLNFAVCLGDELLNSAEKDDYGYSWKSIKFSNHQNLTGFSHGTAGVGYALLELFQMTGDLKYLEAAEKAFDYERFWFDANTGNWPDFRKEPIQAKGENSQKSFSSFWCHGAPGIAFSRLRAYEILKNKVYKTEAVTALETTKKTVNMLLYSGTENPCLCHGLAGNAESLLYGYQVLGEKYIENYKLALDVGNVIEEMYFSTRFRRTITNQIPGLMTGLAGVGYFFLRLNNPEVPSLLMLRTEDFLKK
ncbi:lanthionine synthetase LanC family protein (plasmid) [Lysinibacillus sp. fkY74-1]